MSNFKKPLEKAKSMAECRPSRKTLRPKDFLYSTPKSQLDQQNSEQKKFDEITKLLLANRLGKTMVKCEKEKQREQMLESKLDYLEGVRKQNELLMEEHQRYKNAITEFQLISETLDNMKRCEQLSKTLEQYCPTYDTIPFIEDDNDEEDKFEKLSKLIQSYEQQSKESLENLEKIHKMFSNCLMISSSDNVDNFLWNKNGSIDTIYRQMNQKYHDFIEKYENYSIEIEKYKRILLFINSQDSKS